MSNMTHAVSDSLTMLRRNLRHLARNPSGVLFVTGFPVIFVLLFVYVFGGTLGAGLGAPVSGGRDEYANYVAPGILVISVVAGGSLTALSVAMDMTENIIARFKTMAISRASVLTGHVLGTLLQSVLALAVVLAVALLVGLRPNASALEWVAAITVLLMVSLAFTWLYVAAALVSNSLETASNLQLPLLVLPFLGSGFAPTESMPPALRWFAEHQPFTPFTETLRGLLMGTEIGSQLVRSLRSGSFGPPSKQPLGEYLGGWLPSRTHLRPTTADNYAVNIGRYICNDDYGIGGVPLRALTRPMIQAFYADLKKEGRLRGDGPLAPKAVHNVHMILRKALEDAVEEGSCLRIQREEHISCRPSTGR
jgi:ABC-2 type transport system permease protein